MLSYKIVNLRNSKTLGPTEKILTHFKDVILQEGKILGIRKLRTNGKNTKRILKVLSFEKVNLRNSKRWTKGKILKHFKDVILQEGKILGIRN